MNRQPPEFNQQEVLAFAQDLSEAFPNRHRMDCPPASELIRMAEHPREADAAISEHLAYCSPCFKDYMEILADLKRRKGA